MKAILIKVCESNESAKQISRIEEIVSRYDNVQIVVEKCLNRCSFCEDTPYVLVNNGIEFGDDLDELLAAIEESIQRFR